MPDMDKENGLPADLKLRSYAALSSTLELERALRETLRILKDVLPADGVFVNFFMKEALTVQFLAHATPEKAERMTANVPVPGVWHERMSYAKRGACLLVDDVNDDPLTRDVLSHVLPDVKSFIMLRLMLDGMHYGVACFYSRRLKAFGPRHADIVRSLHNPIAVNTGCRLAAYFRAAESERDAENRRLQKTIEEGREAPLRELLRHAPALSGIADQIRRVAPYDATVMLTGESGVGKEVVATAIGQMSRRRNAPFVRVNCAAFPESLIESELFGFERGAFTGARERHIGLFEQADQGTLFLDEVGDLPPGVQAKLLRVLQGQSFRRVGGDKEVTVDVRIICATNRDLRGMVREGSFREDLFYRLNVFPITIAPLRERLEDIEPLSAYFLRMLARRYGLAIVPRLSEEALALAKGWAWPGNVRELRNVMARAVLSGETVIRELDFHSEARVTTTGRRQGAVSAAEGRAAGAAARAEPEEVPNFDAMQRAYFEKVLSHSGGRINGRGGAAEIAGMHPNTLRSRLEKLGIDAHRARKAQDA